jgi:hypothetical protein
MLAMVLHSCGHACNGPEFFKAASPAVHFCSRSVEDRMLRIHACMVVVDIFASTADYFLK